MSNMLKTRINCLLRLHHSKFLDYKQL